MTPQQPVKRIYGPSYFSNWADLFMPSIANAILPATLKIPGITPNKVSLVGFIFFISGIISLFPIYTYHLYAAAIILPLAYVLDCLDGQVARSTGLSSALGSYLDKTIDYFKVFALTASLSYVLSHQNGDARFIWLGYIAAFSFTFRYYIKYITLLSEITKDPEYLAKSKERAEHLYIVIAQQRAELSKSFLGKLQLVWDMNKSIFEVEEAELIMFTAVGALFNRLDLVLWVLAISQPLIVLTRLIVRGYQVEYAPERLLNPLKK
jgi:phosphatidylglycerophosphate synthase